MESKEGGETMIKKRSIKLFGIIFLVSIFMVISSGDIFAKEVTFKAVSFLPKRAATVAHFAKFVDAFNKKFKGEASINWVGGPEVIPAFQLGEAVRKGAVDMAANSSSFYVSTLPVSHSIMYSNKTHKEIRASGFFEEFAKIHEKAGLIYLGETSYGRKFYMYTNFRPKTPADISGKKIRVFPASAAVVNALDAAPILMTMPEVYTAMERGVVDGFVMAVVGFVKNFHWHEVTKYMIDHGFYGGSVPILVNPKKWGMLSKDLQDRIVKWKYEVFDPSTEKWLKDVENQDYKLLSDSKTEIIKFSPSDAEAYIKLAYDAAWEEVIKKSPDVAPKLKALLVK